MVDREHLLRVLRRQRHDHRAHPLPPGPRPTPCASGRSPPASRSPAPGTPRTDPAVREIHPEWEDVARICAEVLRTEAGTYPADPALTALR
ncbi:hypothetical protein ACFZAT_16645 [Streptomyces sp. NPDC008163]|uniref:MmyB family transcriptional regulator n=1 Tax=Streptomyces sp. NPDC008163 TaxID=3364818 RepID=UPI0036E3CE00